VDANVFGKRHWNVKDDGGGGCCCMCGVGGEDYG